MKFLLNTGRSVPQGASVEHKVSLRYRSVTSTAFFDPVDMMLLGIEDGDRVRVSSPAGQVVLTAREAPGLFRGALFVVTGPYANHLVSSETHGTGMPDYKDQVVEVEPTTGPVPGVGELMEEMGGLRYDRR